MRSTSREAGEPHRLVRAVFGALDDLGVRWCLLRDDDLESPDGDIDILVARADFDRAREAVGAVGFARLRARGHGSHAFFLGYDEDTDNWLTLDIVTDVRFGAYQGVRIPVEAELLARSQRRASVPVLASGDAYWMLLLHSILDKPRVPERHKPRLVQLAPHGRDTGALPRVLDAVARHDWTAELLADSIEREDWEAVDSLGRLLRRELLESPRRAAFFRSLANRSLRAVSRKAGRARGLMVALLAPDGAGKTTLAAGLRRSFPAYDVRVIYMGLYRGRADRMVSRIPVLYLASRLALAWTRYAKARIHRTAGRLVLLDRYVYDTLVPPAQPLGLLHRAHLWIVGHSLPAPDLVLVLDVPGATAFARKEEEEADSLERQRQGYLRLSRSLRRAHVIDASADADAVRRRAVSLIFSAQASGR